MLQARTAGVESVREGLQRQRLHRPWPVLKGGWRAWRRCTWGVPTPCWTLAYRPCCSPLPTCVSCTCRMPAASLALPWPASPTPPPSSGMPHSHIPCTCGWHQVQPRSNRIPSLLARCSSSPNGFISASARSGIQTMCASLDESHLVWPLKWARTGAAAAGILPLE